MSAAEPTDLELMMLVDGELEPERRAAVEAFLALDADGPDAVRARARAKVAGLRAVSAIVADTAAWPERAGVDVVDGVFAALDAEAKPAKEPAIRDAPPAPSRPTLDGAAASRRSGSAAPAGSRPANDNARLIYGMAFAAAAAAAALFLWGKSGPPDGEVVAARPPVGLETAEQTAATPPTPAPPALEAAPPGEEEPRYGVEVASVDFGQRSGAIYYVRAGGDDAAAAAVTTVVWLTDD